ncbi:MAG: hypothetical protein JW955_05675, partial [Sedimentisphaerales bacterium]|nr:hypothetical protein [Sedimentisphaerales bacterium]
MHLVEYGSAGKTRLDGDTTRYGASAEYVPLVESKAIGHMQGDVSEEAQGRESITLTTPVQYVKGVGPARAAIFEKLGVQTVGDLLEYFPRDWVFAPDPIRISHLRPNESATIVGLVESI